MQGKHDLTRKKFVGGYFSIPLANKFEKLVSDEFYGNQAFCLQCLMIKALRAKKLIRGPLDPYILPRQSINKGE